MTNYPIAALRARLDETDRLTEAATPGPWGVVLGDEVVSQPINVTHSIASYKRRVAHLDEYDYEADDEDVPGDLSADAEFIAASRQLVPDLSAAVRRVLDLHRRIKDDPDFCAHCAFHYPCPTTRALGNPE